MRWLCLVLIFVFLGMWRAVDKLLFITLVLSSTQSEFDHSLWIAVGALTVPCSVILLAATFRLRYHANAYARGLTTGGLVSGHGFHLWSSTGASPTSRTALPRTHPIGSFPSGYANGYCSSSGAVPCP